MPNAIIVSKCDKSVKSMCQMCNTNESTKHILFECECVQIPWGKVWAALNVNFSWKQIVCGFPGYCISEK